MSRHINILFTLLILIVISICTQLVSSQDDAEAIQFIGEDCLSNDDVTPNGTYSTNVISLLSTLTSRASNSRFSTHSVGAGEDLVNGLYVCRPDISLATCHFCVKNTVMDFLSTCTDKKEAIVWYLECMVRYTNRSIFAMEEVTPWTSVDSYLNVSDASAFPSLLDGTMQKLILQAASNDNNNTNMVRFELGKANFTAFEGLYAMVMCNPGITGLECFDCLTTALGRIPTCCGGLSLWTFVAQPSCQVRYDAAPFILPWPTSTESLSTTFPPAPAPASSR